MYRFCNSGSTRSLTAAILAVRILVQNGQSELVPSIYPHIYCRVQYSQSFPDEQTFAPYLFYHLQAQNLRVQCGKVACKIKNNMHYMHTTLANAIYRVLPKVG